LKERNALEWRAVMVSDGGKGLPLMARFLGQFFMQVGGVLFCLEIRYRWVF
jgi:hypothetical protein